MRFDASDREAVLRHAEKLVGIDAGTIAATAGEDASPWGSSASKGSFGLLVERWFGIDANSDTGPDLLQAGIEIKSVPVRVVGRELRAKERTSITMIDYHRIAEEGFEGTPLDLKTRLTLYVFYRWSHGDAVAKDDQQVLRVMLHDRDALDLAALKEAYDHVRTMTRQGRAHLLSEGDTTPVGAATKGSKGRTRTQPFSAIRARPRAFAWRPAYTTALLHATDESSLRMPTVAGLDELVRSVEQHLAPHIGASVLELRARYAPDVRTTAKNVASATFRRILSGGHEDLAIGLTRLGTVVRVIRVEPKTLRPREAVSFTPFDFVAVAETPWEESDVLAMLGRILFIVLDAPKGATVGEARFRSVVLWSAGPDTIATMEQEYERYRSAFREDPPSEWPGQRTTQVLHVRPHGRDGRDVVPLPNGGTHVRSSLWLNQRFVQEVLRRLGA